MQFCLSHPTEGYYSKGDVFGRQGDFITSPEISQIFGELVGVYFLTRYLAKGGKGPVRVIELGPGRGTLMDDVLRVSNYWPKQERC
jgi:NADH dehydrogenase [ubiquinone] 1 alpha subcomplex assembly factor 7